VPRGPADRQLLSYALRITRPIQLLTTLQSRAARAAGEALCQPTM
jgi:hypothetical protein